MTMDLGFAARILHGGWRKGLVLGAALSLSLPSCKKAPEGQSSGPAGSASSAVAELPPLVVKDDTAGMLLTWVDDQGDFHVVEKTSDVPDPGKGAVRVVVAGANGGTGESVYVADLKQKNADGSYPVRTMARSAWDELGASKRKSRLEALAPSAAPPAPPAGSAVEAGEPGHGPAAAVSAIIYGASWCGPCHQAEALLKSLGVKVTKKDIEESDAAQREMQEKLAKVHRKGGSIPVIDVMGQIFVGFSEGALRSAVAKARSATL
jgi:glutaredoxin